MNERQRVSVVIPVKNDASSLARCLTALTTQTRSADQIVVVDNGSEDASIDVARRFGALVVIERTPGIPAAAAAGYDAASGHIILRLDADCVPPPEWVEHVVAAFCAMPTVSAVTGGARFVDGPRAVRRVGATVYLGAFSIAMTLALGHTPLFGSNCAFRRDAWLDIRDVVHRRDPLLHDDVDLSLHLGPVRRIAYVRGITMGISSRPLTAPPGALLLRIRMGFHSLAAHWPHHLPWLRIARRLMRLPSSDTAHEGAGRS
ncbi:MAG: hypothetical protein RI885_2649 [Actinomycetota bacterium]|jgi:glycosyltransferase involved in cell wall biosynthesis